MLEDATKEATKVFETRWSAKAEEPSKVHVLLNDVILNLEKVKIEQKRAEKTTDGKWISVSGAGLFPDKYTMTFCRKSKKEATRIWGTGNQICSFAKLKKRKTQT